MSWRYALAVWDEDSNPAEPGYVGKLYEGHQQLETIPLEAESLDAARGELTRILPDVRPLATDIRWIHNPQYKRGIDVLVWNEGMDS